MKKVLIISPHFAPTNAPDMQRARLAIPYLKALGWEPVVLAIAPEFIEGGVLDPLMESTYPADTRIVRVRGIPAKMTRWAGIGSLWLRCGLAFRAAGDHLLRTEKFDLVFFTTTLFTAFTLGPRWKHRFGVPYILDYQDPWVNDYYTRTRTRPPGGHLKFAWSQWQARRQEPEVLRQAAGVIAVSDAYGKTHAANYPWFPAARVRLIPFGAATQDIEIARRHRPATPLIDFADGFFHHVYAGRCGHDMAISLTAILRAFKQFLTHHPEQARRIRFHFIGTDYAPPPLGREWVIPIAREEGVAQFVTEHCYRVPYFDALYYIVHADALLAVGSNDPTYSASKIFPYILAERPMLVIFHKKSPVLAFTRETGCGQCFSFENASDLDALTAQLHTEWFQAQSMRKLSPANPAAFEPFTAASMTQQLVECFEAAVRSD